MAFNWDESLPKDSDYYAGHALALRSLASNVAGALGTSMNWPGSGGGTLTSAGSVKPGMARAYFSLQSLFSTQVSSTTIGDTSLATKFNPPAPYYIASETSRAFGQNWASSVTSTSGSTATTASFSGSTLWLGGNVVESVLVPGLGVAAFSTGTAIVADVNGSFGPSDTTVVSITFPSAYPSATASLWVETSMGTGTVFGMTADLLSLSGGVATYLLSAFSRGSSSTTGPVSPSKATAHVFAMASGITVGF